MYYSNPDHIDMQDMQTNEEIEFLGSERLLIDCGPKPAPDRAIDPGASASGQFPHANTLDSPLVESAMLDHIWYLLVFYLCVSACEDVLVTKSRFIVHMSRCGCVISCILRLIVAYLCICIIFLCV